MPVITRRKKPITVPTLLWDGTNTAEAQEFCGRVPGRSVLAFQAPLSSEPGRVWNSEEACWISVPAGHHLVRGPLQELYPLSPAAVAETYEPVETDRA